MGKKIDAEELYHRMYEEAFEKDSDLQKWDSGCWIRFKLFENVLKDMPEVEEKTGHWIPVSERLPEESLNSVIGWDAYRERCVFVQYIGGYFQITGSDESFDIVAWMPVPKPYEAKSDPWEKWLYPNRKENKE